MYDVVALGELLIDFASLNSDSEYPVFEAHPGGAPANYLAALSSFGAGCAMIAKVGEDAFGTMLIDTLNDIGIDTTGIIKADDVFTTLAFVTFTKERDRIFSFARKPGADTMLKESEVNVSLLENTKVFHFGTLSLTDEPSRSATFKTIEIARKNGALISFDPNYRAMLWKSEDDAVEMIKKGLKAADIVKISEEEAELVFGALSEEEKVMRIHDEYGVRLLYITKGKEGCFYSNKRYSGSMGIYDAGATLDTTGAGDIFGGSAAFAFLKCGKEIEDLVKDDLESIVRFATVSSGISTTRAGGISSVPTLPEVMDALKHF